MAITSTEIYEQVTNRVLDALSKGVAPWQKPWNGAANGPRNLQSGKAYRGINALLLSMSGYSDPRWTTFNAAKKQGGKVIKGEKSTLVTLWKRIEVADPAAPNGKKVIAMLRYFRVFNVEQCEWPKGLKPLATSEPVDGFDPHDEAEDVLLRYIDSDDELSLRWGGGQACYQPLLHVITLPDRETFKTTHGFYGTAFHEAGHATSRALGRELGGRFGDDKYAREELIAEMTAAFICATLGIDGEFDNSAAYLKGWMLKIRNDPKLIVQAAGKAQKAADLILGQVLTEQPEAATIVPEAIPA